MEHEEGKMPPGEDQHLDHEGPVEKVHHEVERSVQAEIAPSPVRRYRATLVQAYLFLSLVFFLILAGLAYTRAYFALDLAITQTFQAIEHTWLEAVMWAVSWPGYAPQTFFVLVLPILFLFYAGLKREGWALLLAGTAGWGVNFALKVLIRRPRPSPDLVSVFSELSSYSFPSGHVMFYIAFFGFLWFLTFTLLKRSWLRTLLLLLFGALVILVGPSRVFLGQHWSSDVLAGYLAGSLVLILSIWIYLARLPRTG
jgi:membrane-associated phospholipid phosphatase